MNFNLKSEKRILYGKVVKAMDYENNVRVALLSSEKLAALEKQNAIEQESMASAQVEQLDFGGAPTNNNLSSMTVTPPAQTQMLDSNPMMSSGGMNKFINFDGGPTPGDVGPSQVSDANNPFSLPLSNVGGSDTLQVTNPQDLNTLMSIVPTNVETVPQNTVASGSPFATTSIPASNPFGGLLQPQQTTLPQEPVPSLTDLQVPTKEVLANEPTNVNENLFSSLSMDKPPVVETTVTQPAQQVAQPEPATVAQPAVANPPLAADGTPMVSSTQLTAQPAAVPTETPAATTEAQGPKTITTIEEFREYVLDKADEYYQKFLDDIEAVLDQAVEQKESLGALPQTQTAPTLDNPLISDALTHISNISIDPGSPGMAA